LKELLTKKLGKIFPCKSVKPCKNRKKTHGHITLEQEINPVQIPHPSKATFKFPLPGHDAWSNPCDKPRGDVEASI